MPNVVPVQAMSLGGSTRWIVDVIVPGPAFQRNTDPVARSPSMDIDFTSGFQLGQFGMSVSTSQTVCGLAAISILAAPTTGAFLLTSKSDGNLPVAPSAVRQEAAPIERPVADEAH
jgi:hypothetical protein